MTIYTKCSAYLSFLSSLFIQFKQPPVLWQFPNKSNNETAIAEILSFHLLMSICSFMDVLMPRRAVSTYNLVVFASFGMNNGYREDVKFEFYYHFYLAVVSLRLNQCRLCSYVELLGIMPRRIAT